MRGESHGKVSLSPSLDDPGAFLLHRFPPHRSVDAMAGMPLRNLFPTLPFLMQMGRFAPPGQSPPACFTYFSWFRLPAADRGILSPVKIR